MLLVFPNGERESSQLKPGVNRIGSAADSAVVISQLGIMPLHCEIHLNNTGANLQVPGIVQTVSVNGKRVIGMMALRPGDSLLIGSVLAKLVSEAAAPAASPEEDVGATRVRTTMPKYVLRGLSGAVFGKVFPVTGSVVIGRALECDIAVPADEISRRHAQVKPAASGLSVEDLGSANGTYINGKRIQQGFLNPGDELRLDAVRFTLVAPGMEMVAQMPKVPASNATASSSLDIDKLSKWVPIVMTVIALSAVAVMMFVK